jgi:hypothetical protein
MAIEDSGRQVAGFNGLPSGMDSSRQPSLIAEKSYALGVNVTAREGSIKTRPGFVQLDLQSDTEDPDALAAFQIGDFQGATLFTQPANRDEASDLGASAKGKTYIIAVVSGWIFRIDPQTKKIIRLNGTTGTTVTAKFVSQITCVGGVATVTTTQPHQLSPGDRVTVTSSDALHLNVTESLITGAPSLNSFTYNITNQTTTTGTLSASYTIPTSVQGYVNLPKFMDTTYYTLRVAGAGRVSAGAGITDLSKVIIEDPLPSGVLLGRTGTGFSAAATNTVGTLKYVKILNGGSGFSKKAKAYVVGTTNAELALRFSRDTTASTRPWPDRNHVTNRHYFCQAEKYLIIQDGINAPFVFDGENLRRSHTTANPAISMGTGSGTVVSILVTDRGSGYTSAPTVTISAPPAGITTVATANAVFNTTSSQIESITITNAGTGYTSAPTVTFSGGGGSGARAYAILESPPEVPVGSIMAYGQGRLFIANKNRFEIQALDLVGSHVNVKAGTTTLGSTNYPLSDPRASVLFNTENTYLNEGGSLLMPSFMGRITGMQFVPTQNTTAGQGQLFVFCEFGAASFAVTTPRSQWGTTASFQTVLYTNIGAVGPDAFAQVNGDLFFRSNDGLRTYKNATAEMESYGNTAMSAEMNFVLNQEPVHLLQDVSLAYTDRGRVLMTAMPQEYQLQTINSKPKKVYKSLISLDFNSMTGSLGKTAAAYDGIWTGLDMLQVLAGDFGLRNKAFILGISCNLNSLWEIDAKASQDRPIAGSELTFATSFLSGSYEGAALSGKSAAQFNLSTISPLGPESINLTLNTQNESENTTWTPTGMGTQGITLSYVVSKLDVPVSTILSNPEIAPFIRSKTVKLSTQALGKASLDIDLGPTQTTGFLYVSVAADGTMPTNNTSSYSLAITGSSSGAVPIRAEVETSAYSFRSMYELKKIIRADFWFSNLLDQTDVEVYYKPDQYPSWIYWDSFYMLPETSISIRALNGDAITQENLTSSLTATQLQSLSDVLHKVDLTKYSIRNTRGLGIRVDFETGEIFPGTGAAPYQVGVSYVVSPLKPSEVSALVGGTTQHSAFYNAFRTVNVVIPTSRKSSRFFNLFRPAGNYLYIKVSYPSMLPGSSYSVNVTPYGFNQNGATPDVVDTTGFLPTLSNLKPQFAPQIRLMNPREQADPLTNRMFSHGYDFQGRIVWTGAATLQKMFLHCQTLVEQVGGNA